MSGMGLKHARPALQDGDTPEKQAKLPRQSVELDDCRDADAAVTTAATTQPQPTAKEIAAAKAARARLGYDAICQQMEEAQPKLPDGPEPVVPADIEYIPTSELLPLVDSESEAQLAVEQLSSKDWVEACKGLNTTRQLAVHHTSTCRPLLPELVPRVVQSVKSLRSSVIKMAVLLVTDLLTAFGDELLPLLDVGSVTKPAQSLLAQLLLKASSNDKRFVIEEAQRAMQVMASVLSPPPLLDRLLPYAAHKNPKVRGKAAQAIAACLERAVPEQLDDSAVDGLLRAAGRLISDNTPDAREAARQIVTVLHARFRLAGGASGSGEFAAEKENAAAGQVAEAAAGKPGGCELERDAWEQYCHERLGPAQARAVLKVNNL